MICYIERRKQVRLYERNSSPKFWWPTNALKIVILILITLFAKVKTKKQVYNGRLNAY